VRGYQGCATFPTGELTTTRQESRGPNRGSNCDFQGFITRRFEQRQGKRAAVSRQIEQHFAAQKLRRAFACAARRPVFSSSRFSFHARGKKPPGAPAMVNPFV